MKERQEQVYYLAVDIGASSGRHILGHLEEGKLILEEVYRFENGMRESNGSLVWDIDRLVEEIKEGLRACKRCGKIPSYMGIDTWGVDFVLLDKDGNRIGDAVGYRDHRTDGIEPEVYAVLPESELYRRTGIQRLSFNTIYQLWALKKTHPDQIDRAASFLMIPDYLNYALSGIAVNEYTNATTGQLVNSETGSWDDELLQRLGLPREIFGELRMPGQILGKLTPETEKEVGYNLTLITPATHDTGSAVLAVPADSDDAIYISSGTWSLMGVERTEPDTSPLAQKHNFTNEGGYNRRFRFLKNIMGLWMIQSVKKEEKKYSFPELSELAKTGKAYPIDVNDSRFLSPASMEEAVREAVGIPGLPLPDLLATIYNGLAEYYAKTAKEIEEITGKTYPAIHIIGGGCRDDYLSALTAEKSGKRVFSGPVEATAIGNLLAQMIGQGVFGSLGEARRVVYESFDIREIFPRVKKP